MRLSEGWVYNRHTGDMTIIFKFMKGYCTNGDLAVVVLFN